MTRDIFQIASAIPSKIERVPSKNLKGVVTSGPWGGNGGSLFDDGVYDGIRQINLSRNVCIVSIRVCYEQNGQPVWGSKNGGTGSFKSDKVNCMKKNTTSTSCCFNGLKILMIRILSLQIVFDYPSEILTHLTGYHGPPMIMGPNVIKSLTFHTTKGKYGPYGEEQGEFFSTKLKEGSMIVGFHGRKGLFIDAIGVHVLEGKVVLPTTSSSHNKDAVISSISNSKSNPPSKSNNQTALATKKGDNSEWPFKIGKRGQNDEVSAQIRPS